MHIETEATQHLQRAAEAARAASHVLARTPDAARNAALRAMAAALRSQSAANTRGQCRRPCRLRPAPRRSATGWR